MLGSRLSLVCALALAACNVDGAVHGVRDECAEPSGAALGYGCEQPPIETPEDVCWRLVRCGVIPVEQNDRFDWGDCVAEVEAMFEERFRAVAACVEVSTCDELLSGNSPEPYGGDDNLPLCLQHGDQ